MIRERQGGMGPRDGDLTWSPIKVEPGSVYIVAEIQQSGPCPLGKPLQRWGDCFIVPPSALVNGPRREAGGKEPGLPSLLNFDSLPHSSFWFLFHLGPNPFSGAALTRHRGKWKECVFGSQT